MPAFRAQGQALSQVLWSTAKLGELPARLSGRLAAAAAAQLPSCGPQELANIAGALAMAGLQVPKLLDAVAEQVQPSVLAEVQRSILGIDAAIQAGWTQVSRTIALNQSLMIAAGHF